MRTSKYPAKLILPGLAALAATMLSGHGALAGVTTGSGITFATQSVAASSGGGSVTIGVGGVVAGVNLGSPVKYVTNAFTQAAATPTSFTMSFTLPAGVLFATTPSATGDGVALATATTPVSGGIGSNFIVYSGSTSANAVAAASGFVTLGAFNVTGATALASTNATTFKITVSVSSPIAALNDGGTGTAAAQLASSASSIQVSSGASLCTAAPTLAIDITSPSLGKQFLECGVDTKVGDQGDVIVLAPAGLALANDSAGFTPASTGTVTLTGNYGGVSTPFLLAGAAAQPGGAAANGCPATAPSTAIAGTVSGSILTFANVLLPTVAQGTLFYEVCLGVSGSVLIAGNPQTSVAMPSPAGVTTIAAGTLIGLDAYLYNGAVQQILYTGVFPPYLGFVRITNNTGATAAVQTVVQPDSGGSATTAATSGTTSTTVNGNSNVLIPAATIIAGSGVTLDSTGRASMLFLTPGAACNNNSGGGACPVSVEQFIVDPNGTITFAGSGASP